MGAHPKAVIGFEMYLYVRFMILISAHRFEAIFCHRFSTTFSKDMEKFWHLASENTPDFYAPTLKKGTLVHCDKQHQGMHPKMLLYALDELSHMFRGVRATNLDGQRVVAYEILSFALLHFTEWRGKPINPDKTCGDMSTMVDVNDEKGLKRLTWAVYDGVLLPSDPPQLQGRHNWVQIIAGTYCLVFWGEYDCDHCPPCTAASFDAKQVTGRAKE